jgi:hypothetical protein
MNKVFFKAGILSFSFWGLVIMAQGQQVVPTSSSTQADSALPATQTSSSLSATQAVAIVSPSPTPVATAIPAVKAATVVPTVKATPAKTEESLHLKDKFALGTDSLRVDENSTGIGSTTNTASLTALDAVWWFSDDSAIDFLATVSTAQTPGVDFNGNPYQYTNQIYGGGLGYRCNVSSPMRDLKIQGLARFTYGNYSNQQQLWYYAATNTNFETGTVNSESYNFIAGLGFEYFLPFCENLSVQSYLAFVAEYSDNSASLNYNSAIVNYGYTGYNNTTYQTSYWRTGLLLNGLSLSSVSVHYYF